jgi:predicted nucleotidyltransferase
MTSVAEDPLLKRLRRALDELYGDRIERVVLFGSRARGHANEDSDYDIAVFLDEASVREGRALAPDGAALLPRMLLTPVKSASIRERGGRPRDRARSP